MNYTHETSRGACSANCQARDMEFVALYNDTLKLMIDRGVAAPRREAIRFTIHNGHPRYHVSYKRAYAVVCQLINHGKKTLNNHSWARDGLWRVGPAIQPYGQPEIRTDEGHHLLRDRRRYYDKSSPHCRPARKGPHHHHQKRRRHDRERCCSRI